MPFTVITLKKVPNSLRGDLTRWMQEITTGVYVGNYNSRIRDYLWKRVTDAVGDGEAAICFSCRNEIGYSFYTCNTERQVVDYEGIPLVLIPVKDSHEAKNTEKKTQGFSKASKYYQARRKVRAQAALASKYAEDSNGTSVELFSIKKEMTYDMVFLDIETTGLNVDIDQIIEIGAIRVSREKEAFFHRLIHSDIQIPEEVGYLTGITDDLLNEGTALESTIIEFNDFIQGAVLVGYNISFDIKFLNKALEKVALGPIHNETMDLMFEAKRKNSFQANYKFETTLKEYGIDQEVPHRAFEDAKLVYQLYYQMGLERD